MYYKIDLKSILRVILLEKESLVPPRMHYTHNTVEYVIYVVVAGRLELNVNGKRVVLVPGDVRIFNKGDYQEAVRAEPCEYYYIHFDSPCVEQLDINEDEWRSLICQKEENFKRIAFYKQECYDSLSVYLPEQIHVESASLFEYIVNTLKGNTLTPITLGTKQIESRFDVSTAVGKILLKLENANKRDGDKSNHIANKIASFVHEHCFLPISGEDIEKEFYLSFDYANRIFKKVMGTSIMRYRNGVRLEHAKTMLLTTDMPLTKIAADVGFENPHYFSRIFKKSEGISPSEYKSKFLKRNEGD